MDDSILLTIKKLLGIPPDYDAFDTDVIIAINSTFMILSQLGVGPKIPYVITGSNELWRDFLDEAYPLELVKSYIYLRARLLFDPPNTGVLHEAIERQIKEFEWRLNVEVETPSGERRKDDE